MGNGDGVQVHLPVDFAGKSAAGAGRIALLAKIDSAGSLGGGRSRVSCRNSPLIGTHIPGVTMTKPESVLELAARFVAAIEAKDVDAVRACYAPQARIWHNNDGKFQSVDDNIKGVHWIHKVLAGVRYDVKQRTALPGGFLQEHVLRGTLPGGEAFAMPACVICKVEGGVITALDEYLDSAHTLPLVAASKRGR